MSRLTIPGGNKKGKALTDPEVQERDLLFWRDRIADALEQNPNKQYADKDRALLAGLRAELQRRKGGGAAPAASASAPRTAAPQQAIQRAPSESVVASSISEPRAVTARLTEMASQYHLVAPATSCDALPPGCGVSMSLVLVNPDDSSNGPAEVYNVGGKLALSNSSLKRIASAAGLDWDTAASGRLDDGSDPCYCHYRAVGRVRNFDGSERTVSGEVEIDMRDGSPQIDAMRDRIRGGDEEREEKLRKQVRDVRLFILRHAESKAKLRAIADMGVKRSYTREELGKPFAVARLMWTGETSDPELKREFARMHAERMMGGTRALYGRAPHAPPPARPAPHPVPAMTVGGDDDWSYPDDIDVPAEERPPSSPQASPAPPHGLPPEEDRGPNPEAY